MVIINERKDWGKSGFGDTNEDGMSFFAVDLVV